jgi:hypothetical protein
MQITTIGLDIAKNVFQVHGIDAAERVVVRKQLRRSQVIDANSRKISPAGRKSEPKRGTRLPSCSRIYAAARQAEKGGPMRAKG